jgi:hypothetical protein
LAAQHLRTEFLGASSASVSTFHRQKGMKVRVWRDLEHPGVSEKDLLFQTPGAPVWSFYLSFYDAAFLISRLKAFLRTPGPEWRLETAVACG